MYFLLVPGFIWNLPDSLAQEKQLDIPNTQALEIPFTSPQDALQGMKLPEGFQAQLFAHEPDIHQPIAVTTDHKGRLWVVECYTYSDRNQNYDMDLRDRVVIFEDTDQDGVHDSKKIFWDQGTKLTGIEVGMGGVWLTAAPQFIFIPDENQDDVPDSEPVVMLDGFEDNVIRHNIVNGLKWGPDGWLYGRHGIQATSLVGSPDATESQRIAMNCSIWRFHPVDKTFEIVAQGGTNPWGFDYDKHGEMFMINTVIGHLFHIVPGARYRRMYGAHFNPYTYQVIEQTADHFHWDRAEEHWAVTKKEGMSEGTDKAGGGHAHTGFMIYQGDNWPEQYRNAQFTSNFHGRRLNMDIAFRKGNSYAARHGKDFMKTSDPWFRGIESIYGPDGGVFLLDWSDIGECHENDGVHRTSGRIFKISYGTPKKPTLVDLSKLSNQQLIDLLSHRNEWFVRTARRILQERSVSGDRSMHDLLVKRFDEIKPNDQTVPHRLRLTWALYSTGGASVPWLQQRLSDNNEHIRAWAVRLLADGRTQVSDGTQKLFIKHSLDDNSGLVRLYLASSLSRVNAKTALAMADNLCQHGSDDEDRVQPHLIWFGVEPFILAHRQDAINLAKRSSIRLVRENIVRRLCEENRPEIVAQLTNWLSQVARPSRRMDIVRGMSKAFEGWNQVAAPKNWSKVANKISKNTTGLSHEDSKELRSRVSKLNLLFGDGQQLADLKAMITSRGADLNARLKAIELAIPKLDSKERFEVLKSEIRDKSVATQVAKSFVHCTQPEVANILLNRFEHLQPEGKIAAIETLVSREAWAERLLDAVNKGSVPKPMVSAWHARQIRNFNSPMLNKKLASAWGEIRETSADQKMKMDSIRKLVSQSSIKHDLENGKQLFTKHCASCHTLYGKGGKTGPDLTGSNRNNLNYLLENLIDPSATVAESYRSSVLSLIDGRLITGVVVEENQRTLKIQTKDELLTIDNNDIEDRKLTKESLMPAQLLDPLTDQQVVDLFAYLQGKAANE